MLVIWTGTPKDSQDKITEDIEKIDINEQSQGQQESDEKVTL